MSDRKCRNCGEGIRREVNPVGDPDWIHTAGMDGQEFWSCNLATTKFADPDDTLGSIIERRDPRAMFLREVLASGTTDDGRDFDFSQSGGSFILTVGAYAEGRIVESIKIETLIAAWLELIPELCPTVGQEGGADESSAD